jgi:CspA family cold shock protein
MSNKAKTNGNGDDQDRYQGKVKWFSEKRGYGFIQIDDEEVFIHRSTLLAFGIAKLQNEDIVNVALIDSERGRIVETLFGVERPPIPPELMADTPAEGEVIADVKFFNNHKGYGFIVADEVDEDIFIHFRVLEKNGFSTLEQGQRLLVGLEDGERGKQVTTIRIYTGDDDMTEDVVEEPPKKNAKKSSAKTRKDDKPSDEA